MGAEVDVVAAYQTRQSSTDASDIIKDLDLGAIDMVTFTSSSTVTNFMNLLPTEQAIEMIRKVTVACIGPITADTARDLGVRVDLMAKDYTIEGLCNAIVDFYSGDRLLS